MAPTEPIRLPIRWEFFAVEDPRDKSIRWKWRATTHSGELIEQSMDSFSSRTDCEADAKEHGFAVT